MRIGYVTQWFPPEPGTVVPESIARGMADLGHDVDVVTGYPNYPTGRIMPGYRIRPYQRERLSARVTVHRSPLFPSHSAAALPRIANYLSFAAGASGVVRSRVPRPDVWLVYSSPATAAIPALRLLRRHRAPVFLLIQDLWPDSVVDSGFVTGRVGSTIGSALGAFCDLTYRVSGGIGVISPGMRHLLVSRGIPDAKIHDTPNGIDDSHLLPDATPDPGLRASLGLPDGRVFMYAGNLGELQGLEAVIRAFAARPAANLVLVGEGVAKARLVSLAEDLRAGNVTFHDQVPLDRIGTVLAQSDIQLVSLHDTPLLRVTMPSKVQTALASGRAVLAHVAGDAAELVTGRGIGWAAQPGSHDSLTSAIDAALATPDADVRAMGGRARQVYLDNYSEAAGARRLEAALQATISTHGGYS